MDEKLGGLVITIKFDVFDTASAESVAGAAKEAIGQSTVKSAIKEQIKLRAILLCIYNTSCIISTTIIHEIMLQVNYKVVKTVKQLK